MTGTEAPMLLRVLFTLLLLAGFGAYLLAQQIGDVGAIPFHLDQSNIENGRLSFNEVIEHGELLFTAVFNKLDGQGRPGSTGSGANRIPGSAPAMIRTSGPDANSCAGCHNQPRIGGGGDFVANVFVLAQTLDPVTESVGAEFSDERNTLGMFGAGPIEMLAGEMTEDLLAIQSAAKEQAAAKGANVTARLDTKGVSFGTIVAHANGSVDTTSVVGVNADLIVRPFHQKGVVVSIREFTNNAMNHHHGMQSDERFSFLFPGDPDPDKDGVMHELTVGDITAVTLWQAQLGTPGRIIPENPTRRHAAEAGESLFSTIGCATCHVPVMALRSRMFTDPNPYNPPGNLRLSDVGRRVSFDMTRDGQKPRLERTPDGGARVRAYTDLKRHDLCDADDAFFCNERVPQAGISTRQFLTRKLWDVGNSAPYGHRGDLTMITEAIDHHHGEARAVRDAFFALSSEHRADVIEFLKTLRILPDGAPLVVPESALNGFRGGH
jgi:di-heme oxidoreductase (putative peroxidase)